MSRSDNISFVSSVMPLLLELESRMRASNFDINSIYATAREVMSTIAAEDFAFLTIGLLGLLSLVDLAFYAGAITAGRQESFRSMTKSLIKTSLLGIKNRKTNPFGLIIEPLAKLNDLEVFLPALDRIAAAADKWEK